MCDRDAGQEAKSALTVQTAATPHPACPLRYATCARVVACRVSGGRRRATAARLRAAKPSRRNDQQPRIRPPRPRAAPSPRSVRPQSVAEPHPPAAQAPRPSHFPTCPTPARPRVPNPSRWIDQRPRSWPPLLGAASSPRRARSQSDAMMIILLLFLQKQNLAFAVYLFGSVLSSKRLFRGPSTNDMKK